MHSCPDCIVNQSLHYALATNLLSGFPHLKGVHKVLGLLSLFF